MLGAVGKRVGCLLCAGGLSVALAAPLPPLVLDGGRISEGWRVIGLPRQTKPLTQFTGETLDGRLALRVDAQASYGNLVHTVVPGRAGSVQAQQLQWSWRVDLPNTAADLRSKSGDDTAVKVCVSFDLPMEQLPFIERQKLRVLRNITGEPLPAATLCYVWDHKLPVGTLLDNVFSRRLRQIVLRNASDGQNQWRDERRDLAVDFLRAFGDEASRMPSITAVIVAGDADGTGATTRAHVADLQLQ